MRPDDQFTRGERMVAMDSALPHMRATAQTIARELTGQTTGPFAKHIARTVEDSLISAVLGADLPVWHAWQERVEEDQAWDAFELGREAA